MDWRDLFSVSCKVYLRNSIHNKTVPHYRVGTCAIQMSWNGSLDKLSKLKNPTIRRFVEMSCLIREDGAPADCKDAVIPLFTRLGDTEGSLMQEVSLLLSEQYVMDPAKVTVSFLLTLPKEQSSYWIPRRRLSV